MDTLNVMVVDDSGITVKKIEKMLFDLGHNVVGVCRNGEIALAAYDKFKPDLITMDITMPDMDGIEATRRIIAKDPKALIIIVTSHGQEQMVIDAIDAGAKGYVLKPIKPEKLQETINKVWSNYGSNK
jgi:two-component system chemotaxis response regulator CheY